MNSIGDSYISDNDSEIREDYPNMKNEQDDSDADLPKHKDKEYDRNILKRAQRTFIFLEHQSLVDMLEADGEYIVSAGRDHDINVWDAVEGTHIRRLSGHGGPVTGLYLYSLGKTPVDRIIISSSEDRTIRQWSLNKGEELRKFVTDSIITCMGVIHQMLSVTGNHKGYMEVRHLTTGDIYSTILAHMDPVDAIVVEDNYACSATFDVPSCLKVWDIQFEQTVCIYRIESSKLEFGSLALWNSTLFMGATNQQKLHVVNFKTDEKGVIDLDRSTGIVQQVRVVNGWILTCTECKKNCILDVHRTENYEHFGTFHFDFQQVFAVTAIESDSSLKVVLGGSALAVLNFDFILMQEETNITSQSLPLINIFNSRHTKRKSHYTLRNATKNKYSEIENTSDSDEHNNDDDDGEISLDKNELPRYDEVMCNPYRSVSSHIHPLSEAILSRIPHNIADIKIGRENDEMKNKLLLKGQHSVFKSSLFPSKLSDTNTLTSTEIGEIKGKFQKAEPQVIRKKIEEMLDNFDKNMGLQVNKNEDNHEAEQDDILKNWHADDKNKEKLVMKEENHLEAIKEESSEVIKSDLAEGATEGLQLPNENKSHTNTENNSTYEKKEKIDKESKKLTKQKSKLKNQKNNLDKKQTKKNKRSRCILM